MNTENTNTHTVQTQRFTEREKRDGEHRIARCAIIHWIEARFNFAHISNSILSVTPSPPHARSRDHMNWHKNLFDILYAALTAKTEKKIGTNFILPNTRSEENNYDSVALRTKRNARVCVSFISYRTIRMLYVQNSKTAQQIIPMVQVINFYGPNLRPSEQMKKKKNFHIECKWKHPSIWQKFFFFSSPPLSLSFAIGDANFTHNIFVFKMNIAKSQFSLIPAFQHPTYRKAIILLAIALQIVVCIVFIYFIFIQSKRKQSKNRWISRTWSFALLCLCLCDHFYCHLYTQPETMEKSWQNG